MSNGWLNVDLKDIPTGNEVLPKGTYTFSLLPGSKFNDRNPNRVDFNLAVAEGEFVGKRIFSSFPDPNEYPWSLNVFARLRDALGLEAHDGENPVDYLNRATNLHVKYEVIHKKDAAGVDRANVNLFKPEPAS